MSVATNTAVAPFGAITIHRIVSAVAGFADGVRARAEARRTARILSRLPDDILEDIGLTRADIEPGNHKASRAQKP